MPEMIVRILGDTSQLEQSYRRATRDTQRFSKEVGRAGRGALAGTVAFKGFGRSIAFASGGFLTGAGLAAGLKKSIGLASDLNEQISKTNVVFGKNAAEIQAWADSSAQSMGLAQNEALGVASSFGAMFAPLKIVGQQAADQSERLTQLGADLASFYNTSVQDALDAIKSGLVGESEPLRRYGVLLSETRVQQEALAETGKTSASQLTDQEKVLARINLIFKDSKQAQGDFARTSGGFANQTRILNANLKNLGATLGETIIPELSKAAQFANEFLQTISHPVEENALVPDTEKVALIPKLAHEYEVMRERGVAAGDTIRILEHRLGDSAKAAELVGDAIHYAGDKSNESVTALAKLRGQLQGFQVDAEAAAKAAHGVATGIAETAAIRAAEAPRGLAAIPPGSRLAIAAARAAATPGSADDLRVLVQQRELNARKIQSLQNRLSRATGKKARDLADQLTQVLQDDASAVQQIASIEQENADANARAAEKEKAAAKKRADAEKKRRDGLRLFSTERVKSLADLKAFVQSQDKARAVIRRDAATREQARQQRQQFLALGLTGTGEQRTTIRWLRRRLAQVAKKIAGTSADTVANRARLARIHYVLTTWNELSPQVAQEIRSELDDIAGDVSTGGDTMTMPKFRHVSPNRLAAALGLGGNRAAAGILAQYGRGGSLPGVSGYARGGAVVIHNAHFHGVQNVRQLQNEMQKVQRGKPSNRRGAR